MKKNNTKISYDPDADVLSIYKKTTAKIDHADEMGDFVVHFTKQNNPVLIEILNASQVIGKSGQVMLETARTL